MTNNSRKRGHEPIEPSTNDQGRGSRRQRTNQEGERITIVPPQEDDLPRCNNITNHPRPQDRNVRPSRPYSRFTRRRTRGILPDLLKRRMGTKNSDDLNRRGTVRDEVVDVDATIPDGNVIDVDATIPEANEVINLVSVEDVDVTDGDSGSAPAAAIESSDEIEEVGDVQRGIVPLVDYPHMRFQCQQEPFVSVPHERSCANCYCYVCDVLVSECVHWKMHCDGTDKDPEWKKLREEHSESRNRLASLRSAKRN